MRGTCRPMGRHSPARAAGADLRDSSTSGHANWHLDGGGDAPGLNAAIRAIVKSAANHGAETIGIEDGFAGLIDFVTLASIDPEDVPGILRLGGTILGTTNRRNPLAYPAPTGGVVDYSTRCIDTFHQSASWTRWSSLAATERSRSPTSSETRSATRLRP